MNPQTTSIEAIPEERRRGGETRVLMALLIFAHIVFYLSQSLYLPLTLEQLFTFGYVLILTDISLLVLWVAKFF